MTDQGRVMRAIRIITAGDAAHVSSSAAAEQIAEFAQAHRAHALNVASPRASEQPAIYDNVRAAITAFLKS